MRTLFFILIAMAAGCGAEKDPSESRPQPQRGEENAEPGTIEASARFRGFDQINQILIHRLSKPQPERRPMALRHVPFQLIQLLGRSTGNGLQSGFTNGAPNPLNMTLWLMALKGLGQDLASLCVTEPDNEEYTADIEMIRSALTAKTIETVESLCQWNDPEFDRVTSMASLWRLLMGYDAPESEQAAWAIYFSSNDYATAHPMDAIEAMVIGALFSPYFLLQH